MLEILFNPPQPGLVTRQTKTLETKDLMSVVFKKVFEVVLEHLPSISNLGILKFEDKFLISQLSKLN